MARSKPLFGLATGAFVLLSLAACQQLLGLDKLKNCDDGDPCTDASTIPDASDGSLPDGAPDASDDGEAPDTSIPFPDGSTPSDWVNFRMPATTGGLVDAASFPDGSPVRSLLVYDPLPSDTQTFVTVPDAGPGNVRGTFDTVSKRIWIAFVGKPEFSNFEEARTECTTAGARLPTRIELVSLLDPSKAGDAGFVKNEAFGGTQPNKLAFWTSTVTRENDGGFSFWIMDFGTGTTSRQAATGGAARGVLCVK
ncbi:MAG: hypothetical protein U0183_20330 [Polyangiaceae bacterium]